MSVIVTALSEWAASELFVPKKDGKISFCIFETKPSFMMVEDIYALQRLEKFINTLGKLQYVTALDGYYGCWEMNIHKQYRHKTAFFKDTRETQ